MTSSIVERVFDRARGEGRGVLIGYLPLGFPTLDESVSAAITMVENGVDILELGVPYSDPVMDGLVIQQATQQALAQGFKLEHVFSAVAAITAVVTAPALLMTYWNPVLQYGVERFSEKLSQAGGAGLITPDLIPDEAHIWLAASEKYGLDRIFLAAPSSSDERLQSAITNSRGFVYAVSTMGITGTRADVDSAAHVLVERLRQHGAAHIGVGLGISTAAQVSEVVAYADAAIVGSAFVSALATGGLPELARVTADLASGK